MSTNAASRLGQFVTGRASAARGAHAEVEAAVRDRDLHRHAQGGELFALRKTDVDFPNGLILVGRSHERDIPKGGRVEAIPISSELLLYLRKSIAASSSELVFPAEEGTMLPRHTALEEVLRRAMRRAGQVTGYVHKCGRSACGNSEPAADANPRPCPKCDFKLFPVGQVRKIRFHHLRHTTASLLLMNGADLAAVQRIMRHQDPASRPRCTATFEPLPQEGDGAPQFRGSFTRAGRRGRRHHGIGHRAADTARGG
jgi:hypothetical protein